MLNPPPPPPADPLARPVTPEGSIHRIGTSSFVFVRETRPSTPASREKGDVRPSSSSKGAPSSSQGDGEHKNGTKLIDQGASRTHSAVGSRGKEGEGGDNGLGSSRESSFKRTGKISSRATMDSKPSSRRPSFEKKAMPIRASFESKAYTLPIIQALTGLNVPAFRLVILPSKKQVPFIFSHGFIAT